MALRVHHGKSLLGLIRLITQLHNILTGQKALMYTKKSLFGFVWSLNSCDCMLLYTCMHVCTYVCMYVLILYVWLINIY